MTTSVAGKTILIIGLARSGCAAGALLRRHGARTIGLDDAPLPELQERWTAAQLSELAAQAFDEVHTGGDQRLLDHLRPDAVALSPGVPLTHPRVVALAGQVPILGELEWAWRFFTGSAVAVTGTNGKSTTTELIAHLARAAGRRAEALGNVGRPFSLVADGLDVDALAVLEVSSFQLETIDRFRPRVAVVLNLAPDHLDRYADQQAYYAAKRRLFAATAPDGACVTWTGCPQARDWASGKPLLLFGNRDQGADVFLQGGRLWAAQGGQVAPLLEVADLPWRSAPNLLNAMAAVAALVPLGLAPEDLAAGLRTFRGLPHRQQVVARLGGVRFVDDSKATNVAAVLAALADAAGDVVLIAGGRGKGEDYGPLRAAMSGVRGVVVIGEEASRIAKAVAGVVSVQAAGSLEEAVGLAARLAAPRGTVLLSPACASFDMFRDYGQRGEVFARAALSLGACQEGQDVQVAP